METTPTFSLARAGGLNLTINVLSLVVMVAVVLWGAHYIMLRQDTQTVALQAKNDSALISQQLSAYADSVAQLATHADTERMLRDRDQRALREFTARQQQLLPQNAELTLASMGASGESMTGCQATDQLAQATSSDTGGSRFSVEAGYVTVAIPVLSRLDKHPVGIACASFNVDVLSTILAGAIASGQRAVLYDASGRVMTQIGETPKGVQLLTAAAPVADSGWQLQLSQAPPDHVRSYLAIAVLLSIIGFVPVVFAVLNLRMLRDTAAELGNVGEFLRLGGHQGFLPVAPSCKVKETATLLPIVQRIFGDLNRNREAINELSFSDSLTKLPNREYFWKMLGHAFELAKRGTDICLLSLEVSDFQKANDKLGNEATDEILKMVAETLKQQTRKSDIAGRLGVFNFGAIFYNAKGHLMRNRLAQLQQDFVKRQKSSAATAGHVYCKLTGGLTYIDKEKDARPEDALLRADNALRSAKRVGGNHIEILLPAELAETAQPDAATAMPPQSASAQKSR